MLTDTPDEDKNPAHNKVPGHYDSDGKNDCGDQIVQSKPDEIARSSGPNRDLHLHANRKKGIFYNARDGKRSMSRSHFLYPLPRSDDETDEELSERRKKQKSHVMFGADQSVNVAQDYNFDAEDHYPSKWHVAGKIARVPKIVVLSDFCNWTLLWKICQFIFPRDIIFVDPETHAIGNYYYLDQYEGGTQADERFHRIVATVINPYFAFRTELHKQWRLAKKILESDKNDPIYVSIPPWMPLEFAPRIHSAGATNHEHNPDNDGTFGQSNDCEILTEVPSDWEFPDIDNEDNYPNIFNTGIPSILSGFPHFGTNVLHLYVGHWAHRLFPVNSPFAYESWPLTPEGTFLATLFFGLYLGGPVPGLEGRRQIWEKIGFDYGYLDGAKKIYYGGAGYDQFCRQQAIGFKQNYFEFRNLETRIFQYPTTWGFPWDPGAIFKDYRPCLSPGFWFGTWANIGEFNAAVGNPDVYYQDTSGENGGLRTYTSYGYGPALQSLVEAVSVWFPPLAARVEAYYNGIETGTRDFMDTMIADNCLSDYGFKNEGPYQFDAKTLVEYVRAHFKSFS